MSLKYVEDWLDCMAGRLLIDGGRPTYHNVAFPIKLATYDKRFIDSTTESISRNHGLTDKQLLLAIKIITKYKRQWAQLGLDPSYLETDDIPLRLPMRTVDRTYSIVREDKMIRLRFPYHNKLIADMHDNRTRAYGSWGYDRDGKSWLVDLTEGNIRTLVSLEEFRDKDWHMDDDTRSLFDVAKICFFEPQQIPTMDLAYGEVIFRDVPEQAMESFNANRHSDISMDALIALRHGIALGPGIKAMHVKDHPINSLFDKSSWDLKHNRYLSTGEVAAVMKLLPDAEFTFLTHDSRAKSRIIDSFIDLENEKTYIDSIKDLSGIDVNLYDKKKNILVLNMCSTMPVDSMNLEDDYLGVLHMNSDDDGPWPPVS